MNPSMTAEEAQAARLPVLESAVDTRAKCASAGAPDPDVWFRLDGEKPEYWLMRRKWLKGYCESCPVLAQCRELALRQGEGRPTENDMVRAGMTGPELARERHRDAGRLESAAKADAAGGTEWNRLVSSIAQLRTEVFRNPDGRIAGRRMSAEQAVAQSERVQALRDQASAIRTARRARAGWSKAA